MAIQDVQELQSLLNSCYDMLVESGFTKPLSHATLADKTSIVQTVSLQFVILRSLAELQQFRDGLGLSVLRNLKHHGELLRAFFSNEKGLVKPLTAGTYLKTIYLIL